MSRGTHFIVLTVMLCGLAWWLVAGRDTTGAASAAEAPEAAQVNPPQQCSAGEAALQFYNLDKDKQLYAAELSRRTAERREREQAGARTEEIRDQLQLLNRDAWFQVIHTNWPAFQELRARAAKSPDHTTPCTICDGRGKLVFCILCGSSGKCPTCNGTGRLFGELCPNCLGSGKCYLCGGTGRMVCPFCDDGTISADGPPPPDRLPLQ